MESEHDVIETVAKKYTRRLSECPVVASSQAFAAFGASSPRYCTASGAQCSVLNASSVLLNMFLSASPSNPAYDDNLGGLCQTVMSCAYVAGDMFDDSSPAIAGLRCALLERLETHSSDMVLPIVLVSATLAMARTSEDYAAVVDRIAGNTSFEGELGEIMAPLSLHYRQEFLLAVMSSNECGQSIRCTAALLLLSMQEEKCSHVDVLADAISDVIDPVIGVHQARNAADVQGSPDLEWLQRAESDGYVDIYTACALKQLIAAGELYATETIFTIARLNVLSEAAPWLLSHIVALPTEVALAAVEEIAAASVTLQFDASIPTVDRAVIDVLRSTPFRAGNGDIPPETVLLASVYWPDIAIDMFCGAEAFDRTSPLVADAYCQLVFRYPSLSYPVLVSAQNVPLVLTSKVPGKQSKTNPMLLHLLLADLKVQQLQGREPQVMDLSQEYLSLLPDQRKGAANTLRAAVLLLHRDIDIVDASATTCRIIDCAAFNMATALLLNVQEHVHTLPKLHGLSETVLLLLLNQQIHDAFRSGDWQEVRYAAQDYRGTARLLAHFAMVLSASEPILSHCMGSFKNAESLGEKLGYLRCVALCGCGSEVTMALREISDTSGSPIDGLARSYLVHSNSTPAIPRRVREGLYSAVFTRFMSAVRPR